MAPPVLEELRRIIEDSEVGEDHLEANLPCPCLQPQTISSCLMSCICSSDDGSCGRCMCM